MSDETRGRADAFLLEPMIDALRADLTEARAERDTLKTRKEQMREAAECLLDMLEEDDWGQDPEDSERYAARVVLEETIDDEKNARLEAWAGLRGEGDE
jgi:hypothetical protein